MSDSVEVVAFDPGARLEELLRSGMGAKRAKNLVRRQAAEMAPAVLHKLGRAGLHGEKLSDSELAACREILKISGSYAPKESLSASLNVSGGLSDQVDDAGAIIEELSADAILAACDRFVATHGREALDQIDSRAVEIARAEAFAPLGLDLNATTPDVIIEAARRHVANRVGLPSDTTLTDLDVELRALEVAGDPRAGELRQIVSEAAAIERETRPPEPPADPVARLVVESEKPPIEEVKQ